MCNQSTLYYVATSGEIKQIVGYTRSVTWCNLLRICVTFWPALPVLAFHRRSSASHQPLLEKRLHISVLKMCNLFNAIYWTEQPGT